MIRGEEANSKSKDFVIYFGYEYIIILSPILLGSFGRRNSANNRGFDTGRGRGTLLQYLPSTDPESFYNRAPISASIIHRRSDENLLIGFKVIR